MEMSDDLNKNITVIGICGSLRNISYTRAALKIALKGAEESGVNTELIDLREYNLVFCDGGESEEDYPEDVHRLKKKVYEAEGIILGTPEYHGSVSGVLKNALDLLGFREFEGKMVGLVGVSGGEMGAVNALNSLRNIGRSLRAWVLPSQVSIPQVANIFDSDGNIKNKNLENRLKQIGSRVARFASLHSSESAQNFLIAWEEAPSNPGGSKK
jgi:NAD(P)H-dependent FMN reductase